MVISPNCRSLTASFSNKKEVYYIFPFLLAPKNFKTMYYEDVWTLTDRIEKSLLFAYSSFKKIKNDGYAPISLWCYLHIEPVTAETKVSQASVSEFTVRFTDTISFKPDKNPPAIQCARIIGISGRNELVITKPRHIWREMNNKNLNSIYSWFIHTAKYA